jgi:hypothetical protein
MLIKATTIKAQVNQALKNKKNLKINLKNHIKSTIRKNLQIQVLHFHQDQIAIQVKKKNLQSY